VRLAMVQETKTMNSFTFDLWKYSKWLMSNACASICGSMVSCLFGQDGHSGFKKSFGNNVNRLPSRFNVENRRNALMGLILIFKIPGSREMIV
jgi:hypothetical protein